MYGRTKTIDIKTEPGDFVREVTARYIGPRRKSRSIQHAEHAAEFMRSLLRDHAREHFIALYLSGCHHVVSHSLVSLGTATASLVHPREVFQPAILVGACALIVGHNHPSGGLTESPEDIKVTWTIRHTGAFLGIPLLDHIIFDREGFSSLKEKGRLD
ncbi:MAG: JAB domain-containing protein [Phycisphaerae bacterium]|nr:JAB domain-containing protein [Phycisphaerae bacterium]